MTATGVLIFFAAWSVITVCAGILIGHALCERDERVDAASWRESKRYRAAIARCTHRVRVTP